MKVEIIKYDNVKEDGTFKDQPGAVKTGKGICAFKNYNRWVNAQGAM